MSDLTDPQTPYPQIKAAEAEIDALHGQMTARIAAAVRAETVLDAPAMRRLMRVSKREVAALYGDSPASSLDSPVGRVILAANASAINDEARAAVASLLETMGDAWMNRLLRAFNAIYPES